MPAHTVPHVPAKPRLFGTAMTISGQLRKAILDSKKSANVLAQESGVPQPTITRFLNGADMKVSTIDKLADYLRLELQPITTPDKAKRR